MEQRMAEAARLGMERMLISGHGTHPEPPKGLTVVPVKRVNEVQRVVF
jgi:predicted ATP-dependent serine protease